MQKQVEEQAVAQPTATDVATAEAIAHNQLMRGNAAWMRSALGIDDTATSQELGRLMEYEQQLLEGPWASPEPVPAGPPPEGETAPQPDAPDAYIALATELGIESAAVDEQRLRKAICELGLMVYDYDKVDAWLTRKANEKSGGTRYRWTWKGLREKDRTGMSTSPVYPHAVPMPVLLTVQKLSEEVDTAMFFVSDYEAVVPDPFLAVTTRAMHAENKFLVVERWDEPGFRG